MRHPQVVEEHDDRLATIGRLQDEVYLLQRQLHEARGSPSVAHQVDHAALMQLWALLDVTNQTAAVQRIKLLLEREKDD